MNVYWSILPEVRGFVRAEEPVSVVKSVLADKRNRSLISSTPMDNFEECPAVVNSLKNYFGVKNIFDYEVEFTHDGVHAKKHDQEFFDTAFILRNRDEQMFTFKLPLVLFSDEDVEVSQLQPFMERNYVNDNCMVIPGKYNIGRWFRGLEFTAYLKPSANKVFKVNENDILYYIQFHTDKKINFKHFHMNDKLLEYFNVAMDSKRYKRNFKSLDFFYNIFNQYNMKNKIIKEIKKNI